MLSQPKRLQGILKHRVGPDDLATNWQNDVPVLATPVLLWLAELACMRAIDGTIAPDMMTLGYGHDVQHLAPTPENWVIHITAEVTEQTDKIIVFSVEARDSTDLILSGTHTRAIVKKEKFLEKVKSKARSDRASLAPVSTTAH